jgi:hypothetical protein
MRRRTASATILAATAVAALFALTPASAAASEIPTGKNYGAGEFRSAGYLGPYRDEGTCNYWRHAVAASGSSVSRCIQESDGWWFYETKH